MITFSLETKDLEEAIVIWIMDNYNIDLQGMNTSLILGGTSQNYGHQLIATTSNDGIK